MDLESIRQFVLENPDGGRMRMVDGRVYDIPHRDYITFGPPRTATQARRSPHATSFILWEDDKFFLVNALLVAEVSPLTPNSNGRGGKGTAKRRKEVNAAKRAYKAALRHPPYLTGRTVAA